MGKAGMRFARNFPEQYGYPDESIMLEPSPRTISRELMTRHSFQPVPSPPGGPYRTQFSAIFVSPFAQRQLILLHLAGSFSTGYTRNVDS